VTCQSDAHACSEEPRGTDLARNASAHVHRQITSAIRFAFLARSPRDAGSKSSLIRNAHRFCESLDHSDPTD
jgi:hypothetical protein